MRVQFNTGLGAKAKAMAIQHQEKMTFFSY
jgi:hypothetical protein